MSAWFQTVRGGTNQKRKETMPETEYYPISVQCLRTSDKAVLVLDPGRPTDQQELWIPFSLIDNPEDVDVETFDLAELLVAEWFLEKEGWD